MSFSDSQRGANTSVIRTSPQTPQSARTRDAGKIRVGAGCRILNSDKKKVQAKLEKGSFLKNP